jgi:hypothetical protein
VTNDQLQEVWRLLQQSSKEERARVFEQLRREFPIHSLEKEWNVSADLVLEAISRSPDLTKRGVRGVIAEAAFERSVATQLTSSGWKNQTPGGNHPFDFLLVDNIGPIKVQVKMQRLEQKVPKHWGRNSQFYVVETQKTRSGKHKKGGSTRPYQFGEFDVIAVSLHPSSGDWTKFRYTVADWLLPRSKRGGNRKLIQVLQPVPNMANADWCDDFETAVQSFRSGLKKTIQEPPKR